MSTSKTNIADKTADPRSLRDSSDFPTHQTSPRLSRRRPQSLKSTEPDPAPAPESDPAPRLNGSFVQGYDHHSESSAPEHDLTECFLLESRLRNQAQTLVLQALTATPADSHSPPQSLASGLEIILDDSNLLPFEFLRTGDRLGRAVVKIQRADGAAGTGFLVAPGILLTNHHVLPDPATAAESTAAANYETNPPADPAGRPVVVPLRPADLFVANEDLDFAFCAVRNLDHLGVIPLNRNSLGIMRSEYVNIIQHPGGRPKEVALQDSQIVRVDNVVVQYSCDTEPGSSGSPVFNNRWNLVALHHASVESDAASGGRRSPHADPRLRFLNEGIRLSAIALWLESSEAHAPELRLQTARLRAIFQGLDPQAGFFGALGRKIQGRHAAQLVVESYRHTGETLDLAAWDLSGSRRPILDRFDDLAWVIAEMGLDLWFLKGLDPDDATRLVNHLDTHFRLDFQVVPHPQGLGALLLSRSSVLSVEFLPPNPPRPPKRKNTRKTRDTQTQPDTDTKTPAKPRNRARPSSSPPASPAPALQVRLCPRNHSPIDLHLCAGPLTENLVNLPLTADTLILHLGGAISESDLRAWKTSGPPLLAAASSASASILLVPGNPTSIDSVFLSPNAVPSTSLLPETLSVVQDRAFPDSIRLVSSFDPLALRLVLGAPRLLRPSLDPLSTLDPDLERALHSLVARLADTLRASSSSSGTRN